MLLLLLLYGIYSRASLCPHQWEGGPDNTTCSMCWGHGPSVAVDRHIRPASTRIVGFRSVERNKKRENVVTLDASVFSRPWPSHVPTPSCTNSIRPTTAPAREGSVGVCACTEPAGTPIGAVCVGRVAGGVLILLLVLVV